MELNWNFWLDHGRGWSRQRIGIFRQKRPLGRNCQGTLVPVGGIPLLDWVLIFGSRRPRRRANGPWLTVIMSALILVAGPLAAAQAMADPPSVDSVAEIFPLESVQPGQIGVWRTVVRGNEIREFELRVLGVVQDFIGPRQPGIIAEAIDPENVLSGPVGGMSGSPVYIDGKLVGAYAYGYTWPKEQAIIGITPIEQMLALLDFPETPPGTLPRVPGLTSPGERTEPQSTANPRRSANGLLAEGLTRLPTPLSLSGFSGSTLDVFREELALLGFSGAISPIGQRESVQLNLRPGAPIAGVVMSGDFNAAATGTITWVEGDRFLAFGHPFLQSGTVAMPMAGAEIVTVVRSVQRSFKLANVGLPEGRISQDRLPGVAGRRGDIPEMAQLRIDVGWAGNHSQQFQAEMWRHPQLVPVMVAMATLQSMSDAVAGENRQTVSLQGEVQFTNGESVPLQSVTTGETAVSHTAMSVLSKLQAVLDNPFGPLTVSAVKIEIDVAPGWTASVLREVVVGDARPRAGAQLPVNLSLFDHWGALNRVSLEIPLPERGRPGDRYEVRVLDAAGANRLLGTGHPRRSADTLESWLRPLRDARPEGALYVFLVAPGGGTEIGGQRMHRLPPSISATLGNPSTRFIDAPIQPRVLWEKQIPLEGSFSGSDRFTLILE